MGPDLPRRRNLDIGKINVAARYYTTRKTSAAADETSRRLEDALPLAGGVGGESAARADFCVQSKSKRNIIKMRKIRRGGFFPLRSAQRNISYRRHIVCNISRRRHIACRRHTKAHPVRLRKGFGKAVSTQTKYFVPNQYQGRNLIRCEKSAAADFFLFIKAPSADGAERLNNHFPTFGK